jgi:guanylate kinase
MEKRLAKAQKEMLEKDKFDAIILNDSLEKATTETLNRVIKFLN